MKSLVLCLLVAVAAAGCAAVAPSTDNEIDAQKMAAIERAAARSGVQVIWLQPLYKKASSGS